jgi:hypothetical protein
MVIETDCLISKIIKKISKLSNSGVSMKFLISKDPTVCVAMHWLLREKGFWKLL